MDAVFDYVELQRRGGLDYTVTFQNVASFGVVLFSLDWQCLRGCCLVSGSSHLTAPHNPMLGEIKTNRT